MYHTSNLSFITIPSMKLYTACDKTLKEIRETRADTLKQYTNKYRGTVGWFKKKRPETDEEVLKKMSYNSIAESWHIASMKCYKGQIEDRCIRLIKLCSLAHTVNLTAEDSIGINFDDSSNQT